MKTSTLRAIMLLLAASALITAVESRSHGKLAHGKVAYQKQLQGKLGLGREKDDVTFAQCFNSYGYEMPDDFQYFFFKEMDPVKDQCLFVCIAEDQGLMVDGKFNKENFIELIRNSLTVNEEKFHLPTAIAMGDKCEKTIAEATCDTECDLAEEIMACFHAAFFGTWASWG